LRGGDVVRLRLRLNLFTATTKAIGSRSNKHRKKTRFYNKPRTPHQRALDFEILTAKKAADVATVFGATNPAKLTRQTTAIQTRLIALATDKATAITAGISRAKTDEASEHLDIRHHAPRWGHEHTRIHRNVVCRPQARCRCSSNWILMRAHRRRTVLQPQLQAAIVRLHRLVQRPGKTPKPTS
jgi:hypothetical protein